MSMHVARVRVLSRVILVGGLVGLLITTTIVGVAEGIKLERKAPTIRNVDIASTVHAGDNLAIHEKIGVMPGCLPRAMRMLCTERDCQAPGNMTQLLTDSTVVANGTVFVPVPRDTIPRTWFYHETVSDVGCGAFSGVFAPDTTEIRDASGLVGVTVTVLPWSLIPNH